MAVIGWEFCLSRGLFEWEVEGRCLVSELNKSHIDPITG